jgi:hypothetical protein
VSQSKDCHRNRLGVFYMTSTPKAKPNHFNHLALLFISLRQAWAVLGVPASTQVVPSVTRRALGCAKVPQDVCITVSPCHAYCGTLGEPLAKLLIIKGNPRRPLARLRLCLRFSPLRLALGGAKFPAYVERMRRVRRGFAKQSLRLP